METPLLDPKTLEGSFDVSGFCEIQVVSASEVRNYLPGNGWVPLKILQIERVVEISKSMAYQNPGNCPQTHCYTDREILRDVGFIMGRREKSVAEDLTRQLNDKHNENYTLSQEARDLKTKIDKKDSQIVDQAGRIRSLEDRLQEERTEREKAKTAYDIVFKEHEGLKDTLLKTLVKLPGGNEATLSEAIGMVKTHEILGGVKP